MELAIIIPLLLFLAFIFYFFSPSRNFIRKPSATAKVTPNPQEITSDYYEHKKKGELKSLFATFDKNGDGFITKQELKESLESIRIFMTEKEIEELVVKVDSNGDMLIDYDEFCSLYESMAGGKDSGERKDNEEDDYLKEAFEVFDRDKDGLISVEELGLVLSSLGLKEGRRAEACKEMIKKVDVDGDGMVNFEEFKKMMKIRDTPDLISVF